MANSDSEAQRKIIQQLAEHYEIVMAPREQGRLEIDGKVAKENCTHFYWSLTSRFVELRGYTCANPNCTKFEPIAL